MKVYKLKHIKTGLYFTPSKGNGNLSAKGKVYQTKPSLDWVSVIRITFHSYKKLTKRQEILINSFSLSEKYKGFIDCRVQTNKSDWIIEEY